MHDVELLVEVQLKVPDNGAIPDDGLADIVHVGICCGITLTVVEHPYPPPLLVQDKL